jgi:predicted O-linked N-acetylglucosamine transferase (SPINDLY family)
MKPVLDEVRRKGNDVTITIIGDINKKYNEKLLSEGYKCFSNTSYLESDFLNPNNKKPRLLLLVADSKEPAHRLGFETAEKARKIGLPSLSIQHGAMFLDPQGQKIMGYSSFTADKFAVWGRWYYDALVEKHGIDASRLVITGNPQFDIFPSIDSTKAREKICNYFGINPDKKICLLAMAASIYRNKPELIPNWPLPKVIRMLASIIEGVKESGAELIIRPHPAEYAWNSVSWYEQAAKEVGVKVYFNNSLAEEPSLAEILAAVDITITQGSSTGLQSILLKTPAVSVVTDDFPWKGPSIAMYLDERFFLQIAVPLRKLKGNLKDCLNQLFEVKLTEEQIQPFVEKFAHKLDGKANKRVLRVIEDLMKMGTLKPKKINVLNHKATTHSFRSYSEIQEVNPETLKKYNFFKKQGFDCLNKARYDEALVYFQQAGIVMAEAQIPFIDPEICNAIRATANEIGIIHIPSARKKHKVNKFVVAHIVDVIGDTHAPTHILKSLIKYINSNIFEQRFYSTERGNSLTSQTYHEYKTKNIYVYLSPPIPLAQRALLLARKLQEDGADIVVFNGNWIDTTAALVAALIKGPIKANIDYGMEMGTADFNAIVRLSSWRKEGLKNEVIIPMGTDISIPEISKSFLELGKESIVTATFGTFTKCGIKYFETIKSILSQTNDTIHIMAGSRAVLTPEIDRLLSPYTKRVKLLGVRKDISHLLSISDVYLNSFPISGGLIILEAMATGVPIVSMSEHYGNRNQLQIAFGRSEALKFPECLASNEEEYIQKALAFIKNPTLRTKIGKKLKKRFENLFSAKQMAHKFESLFIDLLKLKNSL